MNKIKVIPLMMALALTPLVALAPARAWAQVAATWVVDRDGVECSDADFTSIQAAVDAAQPGDVIRVCPDLYAESVIVNKPLTLTGDPDEVAAVDCFQSTGSRFGDADPTRHAVVDPPDSGFPVAFRLAADDIVLAGFVVQGAEVGVDASDRFSGYHVHHTLIRLNSLFGVDFGSAGARQSRVDHNCLRENRYGLVSELDDDSLWQPSDGPERDDWNARHLANARIDHNVTFGNLTGLEAAGPGRRAQVAFDHNVSREDFLGLALQNSTGSAIVDNEVIDSTGNSIVIGGGNQGLNVRANRTHGAGLTGIRFITTFIDRFPVPSTGVVVTENDLRAGAAGLLLSTNNVADSLVADNTASDNVGNGIALSAGNTGILVRGNQADNNGVAGITAFLGATGNRFEDNSMHGNGTISGTTAPGADARDLNDPINVWINNECDTDIPADAICGVGVG
jgi:Right handed beta helix region